MTDQFLMNERKKSAKKPTLSLVQAFVDRKRFCP
jgi:hypothetical protein